MKKLLFVLSLSFLYFFLSFTSFSQGFDEEKTSEFGNSKEELIYSDKTISQLKYIVDSLNLKYAICDLNKIYMNNYQAKVNFIQLKKGNMTKIKEDMDSGISYQDFMKKYPTANKDEEREIIMVKFKYRDYTKKEVIEFSSLELGGKYSHDIVIGENLENYQNDKLVAGKWIYDYNEKSDYSKETIRAFYIVEPFLAQPMTEEYAKMVQYADCMVDTTAQVFYEKSYDSGVRFATNEDSKVRKFLNYVAKQTNKPEYNDYEEYEDYYKSITIWDSVRITKIEKLKEKDAKFDNLLKEAITEALENGGSDDEFEYYVGIYHSKETELELKRGRRVIGGCSQDNSPRYHALSIAKLSAETVKWEIFLRSHLDIMNDRFERVTDGSYAWQRRKTYIRELEVLDINVLDLLLGVTLRMENPSQNHYYGSIGRIGRALAETNNPDAAETRMLGMIADDELDSYNRILIYYLFTHYNYNLEDKERQITNEQKLKKAVEKLPNYISSKILESK